MAQEKPRPIPLAMIICDTMIEDRITGKKTLVGIFNNITTRKLPCTHHSMSVYCAMSEGIGKYRGSLRCTKLDTGKVIMNISGPIPFPNRLATVEFNFELKNVVFPTAGQYIFELLCDDQPVMSRKFTISEIKDKKEK